MDLAHLGMEYLRYLQSAPMRVWGTHRFFSSEEERLGSNELGRLIHSSVMQEDERTWNAPTAFHAAAWLLDMAALVGQGANVDPVLGLKLPHDMVQGAPLFRGQRDPVWDILPSIHREADPEPHLHALEIFVHTLSAIADPSLGTVNPEAYVAAAQHYGLKTPMLDFTFDPLVAIFFACQGAQEAGADSVVVYWLPFRLAVGLNARLIVPPVWVKRLCRQKGLFLDFDDQTPLDIKPIAYRIKFPPAQCLAGLWPAPVAQTLVERDTWFDTACRWAWRNRARAPELYDDKDGSLALGLARELHAEAGVSILEVPPLVAKPVLEFFKEMLEWLSLYAKDGRIVFDPLATTILSQHNPSLFPSLVSGFQVLDAAGLEPADAESLVSLRTAIQVWARL